ncbi:MAG TPA: hypothetical protein VF069_21055 [Streptosporangiaceae bacterium]
MDRTSDARALAADVKTCVRRLGGTFMKSAQARRDADRLGLPGFTYYFYGRGGVLGDIEPDIAATAFMFFPPAFVRDHWLAGRGRLRPHQSALCYAETCRTWGRAHLAHIPGADRLAELLRRVAESAPATGLPLFAGWRALPLPDDAPARVAQLAHVLREHRGGLHAIAVLATGLTPLEATVARTDGERRAKFLRWPEPYPTVTDEIHRRRQVAEELTDDLAASAYAVLSAAERTELRTLLDRAYCRAIRLRG